MKKVAITGALSSGKSTVCNFLKEYCNAYTVDADKIVHELLLSPTLKKKILKKLGPSILSNDVLDRAKIAEKVFANPHLLKELENEIHPLVIKRLNEIYNKIKNSQEYSFFAAEIPLFYESPFVDKNFYDFVIVVTADKNLCQKRFSEKNQRNEYQKRSKRFLSQEEKAKKADFVIVNNGSLNDLKEQVLALSKRINP